MIEMIVFGMLATWTWVKLSFAPSKKIILISFWNVFLAWCAFVVYYTTIFLDARI